MIFLYIIHFFMRTFKFPYYRFFPKFISPRIYSQLKINSQLWGVQDRLSSIKSSPTIQPWAFIRVKNEIKTLRLSLKSILPVIQKGVIGFNRCTDGSKEFILDFCQKNPNFIPFEYPHTVIPACDPRYQNLTNIPYENTLAGYYNAVLAQIPQNEWLIKIDCDQIYIPEILEYSFSLPKNTNRTVIYSRLNLVRTKQGFKIFSYVRPHDHWLIFNQNLKFENFYKFENGEHHSYEILYLNNLKKLYTECPCYHFPYEKITRNTAPANISLFRIEEFCTQLPREFDPQYFNQTYLNQITQQIK